jgi:asparagine synthase (glutamine-hydrolysing)
MRNIPPLDKKTEESEHVKKLVRNAIEKQPAEALLLSGGIDSSFLAALDSRPLAITIGLHSASADIRKAQKVVEHLGMRWHPIEINFESARQALMEIMLLTNSYDPGLINDIPVYIGMRHASSLGYKKVRSGEFADTIFLGYQYLWTISDVRNYISSLLPNVITSSKRIGDSIGVTTSQPYLDPQLTNFVNQLDREDNIVEVETEVKGDFFDNSSIQIINLLGVRSFFVERHLEVCQLILFIGLEQILNLVPVSIY